MDVHAKSSTAQSWMTLQSHARNPSITKITNAVPKFKKMNSMNVLTTVTVRLVLKNVEMNIVWLYKIALVQKIAHVSYIVIFHEYIRLTDTGAGHKTPVVFFARQFTSTIKNIRSFQTFN